jgi:hypothetical protein
MFNQAVATTCGGSILYTRFCSSMLDPFNANLAKNIPVCCKYLIFSGMFGVRDLG